MSWSDFINSISIITSRLGSSNLVGLLFCYEKLNVYIQKKAKKTKYTFLNVYIQK
ncbi:hypothetical protein J15TS10_49360 [Paenibacillus woosongensis]|uniref:Uncharacterized protein n=1 Tax=Paenibacillus woosongensis TaxID=307580 RepID=A0ABQ4MYW8_9BACL|nr:hypothetical protein J15TS10_49360 [Paenibacillus woosongensis]